MPTPYERHGNDQLTGETALSLPRVGTSEPPTVALLRHLLFPLTTVVGLGLCAMVFAQPFTRPYWVIAALTFALSWRMLGSTECSELRSPAQIEHYLPRLIFGWARVVGILLFVGFMAKSSATYSRAVIVSWIAVMPFLFLTAHWLVYKFLCRWTQNGTIARTHVIVGDTPLAHSFARRLEQEPSLGTLIGFFGDHETSRESKSDGSLTYLGDIAELPAYVRRNSIDAVHIAVAPQSHARLREILHDLRDTTASIFFLLDVPHDSHSQSRIVEMAGTPMLAYMDTPYCGLPGAAKRALDVTLAIALLIMLWPVLLAVALLVRFDSRGPIIFKQRRYGLNGEEIAVYKFRTMTVCQDGDHVPHAQREDARVTRVGKFLRRTSLDELPQLFCVVAGSMSLVGPRPHAVAHNEQYRRIIDGYMLRHKVQPGMTGWAQVNGFRGAIDTPEQMRMRVAYDLDYMRHWSPWVDLKILWRTAWLVVRDRNAY